MRELFLLCLALMYSSALHAANPIRVYGPGGPAPAIKEAAATFSKAHHVQVEVVSGPTSEWKDAASKDAYVVYSGSEAMMTDFINALPSIDKATVTPLYLRPSAILVRPGNPSKISGMKDLFQAGRRVIVVHGSGQAGLWEDVAGRMGDVDSVRAFRSNIVAFAPTSADAKRLWEQDKTIEAWLIWNIWEVANPSLADVVEVEPQYRVYRDVGVALTEHGKGNDKARAFVDYLSTPEGAAIFAKWGWITKPHRTKAPSR